MKKQKPRKRKTSARKIRRPTPSANKGGQGFGRPLPIRGFFELLLLVVGVFGIPWGMWSFWQQQSPNVTIQAPPNSSAAIFGVPFSIRNAGLLDISQLQFSCGTVYLYLKDGRGLENVGWQERKPLPKLKRGDYYNYFCALTNAQSSQIGRANIYFSVKYKTLLIPREITHHYEWNANANPPQWIESGQ